MCTDNPLELTLKQMAAERGLRALSNERPKPSTGFQRPAANKSEPEVKVHALQEMRSSRAERRTEAIGGNSWMVDIGIRVSVPETNGSSEASSG